jgi:hypothetical protein
MQSKALITTLTILLGLLCTSGAMAAQKKPLHTYIGHNFYRTKIMQTASKFGLALDGCAQRNALVSRKRYDIVSKPVFVPEKLHPIAGAWAETVWLSQCQKSYKLKIIVVAHKDGKMPEFVAKAADED